MTDESRAMETAATKGQMAETDRCALVFRPLADIIETGNRVSVQIEMPGVSPDDVDISVEGRMLTVRGRSRVHAPEGEKKIERKDEKKGYYVSERSYGSVMRSIPLPPGVDGDKADATFRNGVLTVRIPHSPEAKSKMKKIEVRSD